MHATFNVCDEMNPRSDPFQEGKDDMNRGSNSSSKPLSVKDAQPLTRNKSPSCPLSNIRSPMTRARAEKAKEALNLVMMTMAQRREKEDKVEGIIRKALVMRLKVPLKDQDWEDEVWTRSIMEERFGKDWSKAPQGLNGRSTIAKPRSTVA